MYRFYEIKNVEAAGSYYPSLKNGDYHIQHKGQTLPEESIGRWGGRVSERLGLQGEVTEEAFKRIIDNRHPDTGERLTLRTNKNRRPGWDLTFSWPKSASELYTLTGDARIMEAALKAMRETMGRDVQPALGVRLRGKNADKLADNVEVFRAPNGAPSIPTGEGIWAEFTHLTGRPVEDPELGLAYPDFGVHHHVVLANVTWNPNHRNRDGSLGAYMAIDPAKAKSQARLHEAAFHVRFADAMAEMGYPVTPQRNGYWEVAGWTRQHIEKFSRRGKQVEEKAAELGITDPDEKAALAAKTRHGKNHGLAWTELMEIWHKKLTPEEAQLVTQTHQRATGERAQARETVHDAIRWVLEHNMERSSAIKREKFVEQVYRRSFGIAGKHEIDAGIRDWFEAGGEDGLIEAEIDGEQMVTWERVVQDEVAILQFAERGRNNYLPLGPANYTWQTELFKDETKDTAEQERAVRDILTSSDRVIDLRGGAGTGKTSLMQEAVAGIGAGGSAVHVFAPTAQAARKVLREEGFESADTVARLLMDENMQRRMKDGVLWIDEAGLLGVPTVRRIFEIAEAQNCRVVLSGDKRQHDAVERGEALALLEDRGAVRAIELNTIRRQKLEVYRQAVDHIARGEAADGFETLERMGAIREIENRSERHATLARDYVASLAQKNYKGRPKKVLAVAPTHREGESVNAHIRAELRASGFLRGPDRTRQVLVDQYWTEAERRRANSYQQVGQVVQFHRATAADEPVDGKPFFNAGQTFHVVAWKGDDVWVENDRGMVKRLPLEHADRFTVLEQRSLPVAAGDKLRITKNNQKLGLNNGQLVEVSDFSETGGIVLTNGITLGHEFGNFAHGYVTTSNASQGMSVDEVFIAQSRESGRAGNRKQFYVSVSRGKENARIYTDDASELKERVGKRSRRISGLDIKEARKERKTRALRNRDRTVDLALRRGKRASRRGDRGTVRRVVGGGVDRFIGGATQESRPKASNRAEPVQGDR